MMNQTITYQRSPVSKLVTVFLMALGVVCIGLYLGRFISQALFIPLSIAELVLILIMVFSRKRKSVGYPLLYAFMLLSGITLNFILSAYISMIGAEAVFKAFGIAVVSFVGVALYAAKTKEDFSFLGGFLTLSLFAIIGISIISIFMPFGTTGELIFSAFGILIFLGFTIFDINRITKHGFSESDIPMIVVNIYLNFINLFLFILRFFGVSRD